MKKWLQLGALALGGLLCACTTTVPLTQANVRDSVLAPILLREGSIPSPIGTTDLFSTRGFVYILTVLTGDAEALRGTHTREYRWYANGVALGSSKPTRFRLGSTPYYLWDWTPTITLGEGNHAVELYLDGERVARLPFRVSNSAEAAKLEL